ncbi:MAG: hypothetical protein WBC91_17475, partial [Phototrophicaceae bacterium]
RQWTQHEIEIVRELAKSVMTEIELREQIKAREAVEARLNERNRQYKRTHMIAEKTVTHMKETIGRGAEVNEIMVYLDDIEQKLQQLD